MQLSGNTIFITGGTSGIGLAFAEAFIRLNNKVIICGRRADRLAELEKLHGSRLVTYTSDISNTAERETVCNEIIASYPEVNVLMNNAGVQLVTDLTKAVDLNRVRSEVETNFIAPLHIASLFAPHLSTKTNGVIINISSGLAFCPISFMPVYCATKAGIHSLTLSLRHQLRNTLVKVFEIIPPSVDTELGSDRRVDKSQTHGGMPVDAFISEAMDALTYDVLEAPIAMAKTLHEKREAMFFALNQQHS